MRAAKKGKYVFASVAFFCIAGVLIYILLINKQSKIDIAFDMANETDTVCCTVAIYQQSYKSGPSHYNIDVKSISTRTGKTVCKESISSKSSCSMENCLGYSSGFVWFRINEKPMLVYVFKEDSVLDQVTAMTLINSVNPGTKLAYISYAPTASVVYASLTNGDQMIIDPKTLHYILPTTEKESYRYGLSGKNKLYRDNIDLNDSQQVVLQNNSASNIGLDLVKKTYTIKDGFFDSLKTSEGLVFMKFISPYFSILKGNVILIQHRNFAGPESKPMISAFDLASNRMLWSSPIPFEIDSASDPLLFDALSPDYFYALNNNKLYKINIKTGKLVL